jgi:hypothetical protein
VALAKGLGIVDFDPDGNLGAIAYEIRGLIALGIYNDGWSVLFASPEAHISDSVLLILLGSKTESGLIESFL